MTEFTPQLLDALRIEGEKAYERGDDKEGKEMMKQCVKLGLDHLEQMCRTSPELLKLFDLIDDPGADIIRKALKQRLAKED